MSLRQRAARGVFWSAIQNWGSGLLSMAVFLVLARLLKPEAFGLVALASAFTAFLAVFLNQGFAQAIIQRVDVQPGHLDTAFWINVLIGIVLTGVGIAAASLLAHIYHEPRLTPIIRWLALGFLIGAFSNTQGALLQRRLAFKTLAIRKLVASVAGGCVGIGMAISGFGVWSLVGQNLVGNLVGVVVLWQASKWRPGFNVSAKHAKDLFSFGVNILGVEILNFVSRRSDDLLIGYFLGPTALGYYTLAYGLLLRILQVLTQTVGSVTLPTFSRLQDSLDQMRHAFLTATRMSSLVAFPAFMGVAALAPELVHGLLGEKWAPSIPVMRILPFVGILFSVYYFNGSVVMACGKPSWLLGLRILGAVSYVAALLVVVHWGIVAVAAAFVLLAYLFSPISLWFLHKLIGLELPTYLRQFVAPLTGSMVMVAGVTGAKLLVAQWVNLQASLAICILVGAVLYALSILTLAPGLPREALELVRIAVPWGPRNET